MRGGESGINISTIIDICNALRICSNELFNGLIDKQGITDDEFITNSLNMFNREDKEFVYNNELVVICNIGNKPITLTIDLIEDIKSELVTDPFMFDKRVGSPNFSKKKEKN